MAQQNKTTPMSDRYVTDLVPYCGGLFTPNEYAEIVPLSTVFLSADQLPREIPPNIPDAPVEYRRSVYGPYDKLPEKITAAAPPLYSMRYALHYGQTKLCLSELEALVFALRECPELKYVVYAGAAPGNHIPFLAELFPQLEFHCYDPAPFKIEKTLKKFPSTRPRIFTEQCLFTDEIAASWCARAEATVFISDIRSGNIHQDEFEKEVWLNMEMQQRWWNLMGENGPAFALFKFRLPYTDGSTRGNCMYLDGRILLQPFGPNTSTEGRLFVRAGAKMREYDPVRYENFYFWLNNVVREWASFDVGFGAHVPGLCPCFDCSRLVQIFREYVHDFPAPAHDAAHDDTRIAKLIGRMVAATSQQLLRDQHGVMPTEVMAVKRPELQIIYNVPYLRRRQNKIARNQNTPSYAPSVVRGAAPAPLLEFTPSRRKKRAALAAASPPAARRHASPPAASPPAARRHASPPAARRHASPPAARRHASPPAAHPPMAIPPAQARKSAVNIVPPLRLTFSLPGGALHDSIPPIKRSAEPPAAEPPAAEPPVAVPPAARPTSRPPCNVEDELPTAAYVATVRDQRKKVGVVPPIQLSFNPVFTNLAEARAWLNQNRPQR